MKKNLQEGIGIIEIVVAVAIISATLFGLLTIAANFLVLSRETSNQVKAAFLTEEGLEALRSIRDRSYSAEIDPLSPDPLYYLVFEEGEWRTTTTVQVIDGFTRSFEVEDVYRDTSTDDISDIGTLDPATTKINLKVNWTGPSATSSQEISTYITDQFEN